MAVLCSSSGSTSARTSRKNALITLCDPENYKKLKEELGGGITWFTDFDEALGQTKPDIVSVNTYPDTHVEFVQKSLESGAHVFVEKPLAPTVDGAIKLVELSKKVDKKLVKF